MRISARLDYGMRALAELAALDDGTSLTAEQIAVRQAIPQQFLENILRELRVAGIVVTRRGYHGGFRLARSSETIRVGDVVRVLDGSFGTVAGVDPSTLEFTGPALALRDVWVALHEALAQILDRTTLDDVVSPRG